MKSLPLQLCTRNMTYAIINRSYAFLHFTALIALIYYRLSSFSLSKSTLSYLLLFVSELLLSLLWLLDQAFVWRPVSRTIFPERLPDNKELPAIDVFICTADPKKEPPVKVMNTVLSAMALDYPPEKLSVYLSDDGGSSLTLNGVREAWLFAKSWLPFCRRFGIKTRCPKVYFSSMEGDGSYSYSEEYAEEKEKIKRKYESFKERVNRGEENDDDGEAGTSSGKDHPPIIEVIHDKFDNEEGVKHEEMPLLVYVSREKSPFYPHNFKAGALNVLLRVSGIITNSPYILVLDCDMYCNDPTSARQAMCFHLDPEISSSLAFVQFPQKFHNITEKDIYDGQLRKLFMIRWPGIDGLQGPILSGTGFYMKRQALYGNLSQKELRPEGLLSEGKTPSDWDLLQLKESFGHSNEFIRSAGQSNQHKIINKRDFSIKFQQEAQFLATSTYEKHTLWGQQVGFLYHSVCEDFFTGFILHCQGRTSVLCNPSKPAFLGNSATNLNDLLIQGKRWSSGLLEVALSRFCPFIYGLPRMSLLQTTCYAYLALQPLYCLPLWVLAIIPQVCLLNGIPTYPKVSSSWFMIFSFIFIASLLKHLEEVLSSVGSFQIWLNEQRIWMIKSVTACTYGSLDAILKSAGMKEASFLPTNKVADEEQITLYQMGKFNFQASTVLLAPIVTLLILNMIAFIGGFARMLILGSWNEMFGQVFLSLYILMVNYPVIEGMLLRKDKGRVPTSITLLSLVLSILLLCLGYMVLSKN